MGSLIISDKVLEQIKMSPAELRQEIAVYLYANERLSIGQASDLAGMDLISFQRELTKRDVHIHYDKADLVDDLKSPGKPKTHFLSDLAGSITPKDGEELAAIVNREFQNIEGEW